MRLCVLTVTAIMLAGCATGAPELEGITYTKWQATGYLSPSQITGEDLGRFETRAECEAAVEGWKSKQVVGTAVSGECLAVNVTE